MDGVSCEFETNTSAAGPLAGKVFHLRGGSGVERTELQWLVAQYGGLFVVDGMVFTTFHCGSYGGQKRGRAVDYVVGGKKATRTMGWADLLDMVELAKAAGVAAAAAAAAAAALPTSDGAGGGGGWETCSDDDDDDDDDGNNE